MFEDLDMIVNSDELTEKKKRARDRFDQLLCGMWNLMKNFKRGGTPLNYLNAY